MSGLGQTFSLDRDSRGYPIVALSFQRVNDVGVGLSTETSGIETAVVRLQVATIFATVLFDEELNAGPIVSNR